MQNVDIMKGHAGGAVPMVLWLVDSVPAKYQIVGRCHVNGIMRAEAIGGLQKRGKLSDLGERFALV